MNVDLAIQESKQIENDLKNLANGFALVTSAEPNKGEDEAEFDRRQKAAIEQYFSMVADTVDTIGTKEHLDGLKLGAYLYYAKQIWEFLPLTSEHMKTNKYKWREFAKKKSNGRSPSTTNNLINAAEVFLVCRPTPPDGVEFNPWIVPTSNLIIAAHRAQTGKLSDTAWKMLADPDTGYRDMLQQLHKDDPEKDEKDLPMSEVNVLYIDEGVLYFKDTIAGTTVGLVSVDDADSDDPSVKRGMAVLTAVIAKVYADDVQKLLKA